MMTIGVTTRISRLLVRGRPFGMKDGRVGFGWTNQLDNEKQVKEDERQKLLQEAAFLTRSLYRLCLRSVNVIRPGNDMDNREFKRREEEFVSQKPGLLSMARPPDREDELESRADYYYSYARESFLQESDCLDENPLRWKDLKRFLYYLRKGDKDRKWLLGDMMFPDPYKDSMDASRIQKFEDLARQHVGEVLLQSETVQEVIKVDDEEEEDLFDDMEHEDAPEWFKQKYPHLL